jgi:glutamyl/glutaminyl-tRNA synthetase
MPEDEYIAEVTKFLCRNPEGKNLCAHPNFSDLVRLVVRERISKFSDVVTMFAAGEFDWLLHTPAYEVDSLLWKDASPERTRQHLKYVYDALEKATTWDRETLRDAVWEYAEANGTGDVLWPTRVALTGQKRSPDPFTVAYLLGKEEALTRLQKAEHRI